MNTFLRFSCLLAVLAAIQPEIRGLDNGLAKKPPMGWLSWVAFYCQVDCKTHPLKCLSQDQIVAMANTMIKEGYRDAGYEFVIIDDCWLAPQRDARGKLQADPQRFSKGRRF